MLSPESNLSPTAAKMMIGSTIICEASSLEEARKLIEADIYFTAGVVCPSMLLERLTEH
jgi:uncharacterized protein YciI